MMKSIFILIYAFTVSFVSAQEMSFHDLLPSYKPPTERQLAYDHPNKISAFLELRGIPRTEWEFWTHMISQEKRGFFGYHAAKQELRVFHDIVKIIFEEILEFHLPPDFFFFRVPLDPAIQDFESAQDFFNHFLEIDDSIPEQRDQLVSLNYTLFGNYEVSAQCTVCYFSKNRSWFPINYESRLQFLFEELGIPHEAIPSLFETSSSFRNFQTGVIYQFFDLSHEERFGGNSYDLADRFGYTSLTGGIFDGSIQENLSDYLQKTSPQKFDRDTGQVRLIMNHRATLNPRGPLAMKRYDLIDPGVIEQYEANLRQRVKDLPRDPKKVQGYKQRLNNIWH